MRVFVFINPCLRGGVAAWGVCEMNRLPQTAKQSHEITIVDYKTKYELLTHSEFAGTELLTRPVVPTVQPFTHDHLRTLRLLYRPAGYEVQSEDLRLTRHILAYPRGTRV